MSIGLLLIIHDTSGRHLDKFRECGQYIFDLYEDKYVAISDETLPEWEDEFKKYGFETRIIPKKGVAHARREIVKFGLESSCDHFHYCDYDKMLSWVNHPEEIEELKQEIEKNDYLIIGRADIAFSSYPEEWRETERITNKIFALKFGRDADICSGSCGFSRIAGEIIAEESGAKMTDAEWPLLINNSLKCDVGYKEVEGLKYVESINGLPATKSEIENWVNRTRLTYIISKSILKF